MNWKRLTRETIFANRYFKLYQDSCEMDGGKVVPRYFVVDFPEWVQIVAVDREGRLILVDQYRYPGAGRFIEFPGGSTHPDRTEDPLEAARRELREETGYVSDEWKLLGTHFANPALQVNRCHTFLAKNCERVGEPTLDPFEELNVVLMKPEDYIAQCRRVNGTHHSLMLAALFLALPEI